MKNYMKLPKKIAEEEVRIFARLLLGKPDTKQTRWMIHKGVDFNLIFEDESLIMVQCLWTGEDCDYFMDEGLEESYGVSELFYQLERGLSSAQRQGFHKDVTWRQFYERNKLQRIEEFGYHHYEFATFGEIRSSGCDIFYQPKKTEIEVLVKVDPEFPTIFLPFKDKWANLKSWGPDGDKEGEHVYAFAKEYIDTKSLLFVNESDDVFFHAKLVFNFKKWKYMLASLKTARKLPKIKSK